MSCASSCRTRDHKTFGDCIRSQRQHIGRIDIAQQKSFDRETWAFRDAVRQGVHPDTTQRADTERAMKISDQTGRAYVGW